MVSNENVRLIWFEVLKACDAYLHPGQAQPVARAPVGPPVNPILSLEQDPKQQHRRRED